MNELTPDKQDMKHEHTIILDLGYYIFSAFRYGDRWEMSVWDLTEAEDRHWIAMVITESQTVQPHLWEVPA